MKKKKQAMWAAVDRLVGDDPGRKKWICAALILGMTALQWLEVDLSTCTPILHLMARRVVYPLINMGLLMSVDLLFLLLTRRWGLAYALGSIFACIWGLADFYVWYYSGDLLTVAAMRSAGTALDVIGGYKLVLSKEVVLIIAGTVVNLCAAMVLGHLMGGPVPWKRHWIVAVGLAALLCADAGSLVGMEHFDQRNEWQPRLDAQDYGYPIYFVRQIERVFRQVLRPDGYDEQVLDEIEADFADRPADSGSDGVRPDIVFVLNETYYFLEDYMDMDTDVPYHETYDQLQNAIKGRTVVPWIGSSTNRTEYELFTSNSMSLLACQAPYTTLELSEANNIVRYLKNFGYTAVAMHDASPTNYNRQMAFPQLGFDQSYFRDDFTVSEYGYRWATDESNYEDMFRWYEQCGDGPRFMYLLSYQNHGGWEQNDASLDTVHVQQDFGDLTDDLDEYLTSLRMSDEAIGTLIDYFSQVDRPVILCMMGDHTPKFITELYGRDDVSDEESAVIMRSTPFFIWANDAFGALDSQDGEVVTLTGLMPTLLDIAGIPLSPFYQTILDISEEVPVRLSTGLYQTADGTYGRYETDDALFDLISPYYFMEYNNLQKAEDRRQVLFDPPSA